MELLRAELSVLDTESAPATQALPEKVTSSCSRADSAVVVAAAAAGGRVFFVLPANGAVAALGLDAETGVADALKDGDHGNACGDSKRKMETTLNVF